MPRISYKDYNAQYPEPTKKQAKNGEYPCFYCGCKSQSIDHFIPQSYIETMKLYFDTSTDEKERKSLYQSITLKQKLIPSCKECNVRAGDGVFDTPDEKKSFVKAKLRRKYEMILETPNWSEEELKELDYELQQSVLYAISQKQVIKDRINW